MQRREAIRRISLLLGGTVSTPVLSGILSGCRAPNSNAAYAPRALSLTDYRFVGLVSDIVLPRTDTPGAVDVGVDQFIDTLLADYFSESNRQSFLVELAGFIDHAASSMGKPFLDASSEEQHRFVESTDADVFPPPDQEQTIQYSDVDEPVGPEIKPMYWQLKELVIAGYYTSEIGATQELHLRSYEAYKGDVSLESVGRSWA